MGTEEVVLGVAWWSSINGFLCPQSCTSGGPIVHTTTGGLSGGCLGGWLLPGRKWDDSGISKSLRVRRQTKC